MLHSSSRTGGLRLFIRVVGILTIGLLPLLSTPFTQTTEAATNTQVTSTMIYRTFAREHVAGATLSIKTFSCTSSYPHLVNWKDDSINGATYSEWDTDGSGTSSDPDSVDVLFGGGLDGADVAAKIWCSSLWWPTTWDCGAEGQPDCWGAVQGYLAGTPQQGWMQPEFMFYANGNGLCDDGLGGGTDYRCFDIWGLRHQRDDDNWQTWAQDNQRYGISGKEPINWHTMIGTHESFNSFADGYTFPNHVYSISDQLTIGARYIDLRARWISSYVRLSHTTGNDSTTGGSGGDRAFLYAIHEINRWLSQNTDQVIRLDIGVGTSGAAAPSQAYINDPLARYLGSRILTPHEWCSYLHSEYPSVSRPSGYTYASDCTSISTFVPYRWPTTNEMRELGKQVIIFTNGGSLSQLYSFDSTVSTGNSLDSSAGYGNGFARNFDASTCTRNGVEYLYNSSATDQQRDFFNRAFTTEEEARVFGQAPFAYDSWTGYLVADEDDIQKMEDATISPTHADEATPMDGITNCNVSIMKLDMLGEPGRFDGGFVGVSDLADRRNALIWSWAEDDYGAGGGTAGNNYAMLSATDDRWHSTASTNRYHFACAMPRSGDPTTWPDVLQETWAVTTGTGAWNQGSDMCKAEFGGQGLVFASPRNGRSNQLLIQARDAAGLGSNNVWLAYSDHGIGWHSGAPPVVSATATTTDNSNATVPYTFGNWTNHDVEVTFSAVNEADPTTAITSFTYEMTGAQTGSGSLNPTSSKLTITNEGTTTITVSATDEEGNESPTKSYTIKIDKTPPVASHNGPFNTNEGTTIQLDGTTSSDALSGVASTAWAVDEDDVFDDGDPASYTPIDGPHVYQMKLRVIDLAGNETTVTTTVTAANVAPTIDSHTLSPNPSVEGQQVTASADFSDPGQIDTHTCEIDWGDGTTPVAGLVVSKNCSASHTYADNHPVGSPYQVKITVTDKDLGSDQVTSGQTVNNAAPTVETPVITPSPSDEDEEVTASADFTDPGLVDTHTCQIDWGDGTTPTAGTVANYVCSGSHTYADDNPSGTSFDPYTVVVTVTDNDGASGDNEVVQTVRNVDPTIHLIDVPSVNDHATLVPVTVTATDPGGVGDPLNYAFDCDGNGTYEQQTGSANSFSCYPNQTTLSPDIGVEVRDDDLGVTTGSVELYVQKYYCASFNTGRLRDSTQCNPGEMRITLRPNTKTLFCANMMTGALQYSSASACPPGRYSLVVPSIVEIPVCQSLYTGLLSYRFNGCTASEMEMRIPRA